MSPFRYRDEESSSAGLFVSLAVGAVAGFAVGVLVAQRVGGLAGITSRLRGGASAELEEHDDEELDYDDDELDDDESFADGADVTLEERVLEAFRNDPILSERAVDIGSLSGGVIELAGWVDEESEATHAVTVARGVPGVETVVNRITVGEEEERFADAARRVQEGDPALTEARWEGVRVGTGRRRQGTSDEADRHADPKPSLEDRWLSEQEALRNAADDTEGLAERRKTAKKNVTGDRTGGTPVAPTGVPKADHVAEPNNG